MFQFFEVINEARSAVIDAGYLGRDMVDVDEAVRIVVASLRETWRDSIVGSKVQINFKDNEGQIIASTHLIEV